MATIFISYGRSDKGLNEDFVSDFEPQIYNIYGRGSLWYDRATQGGAKWWDEIKNQIHECQVFVFLVSDKSISSNYCMDEIRLALEYNKAVLQVLLPTLSINSSQFYEHLPDDVRDKLKHYQYVDLKDEYDAQRQKFDDLSRLWGALNYWIANSVRPLTTTERWLLHNQYEILKQQNQDHPDYKENFFDNAIEILAKGYEWYYKDISRFIYSNSSIFSYGRGEEIRDILDMFRFLQLSYEELNDKSDIDKASLSFNGFGGNEETSEMQFTEFMMDNMNEFDFLKPSHGLNSHIPMLNAYRRMYREWNKSDDPAYLTKDDLIRIGKARYVK